MTGLQAWTKYEKDIVKLRQYFDFTHHLYNNETENIRKMMREKKISFSTTIGSTTHHVNALNDYIKKQYPQKLRELVLISLISSTEVYFVRLVKEIYKRDLSLFKTNERFEFSREELFSHENIDSIGRKIIEKDCRKLTSGGIKTTQKYFLKTFQIDFNDIVSEYNEILKYFDYRHLIVHANRIIDSHFYRTHKIGSIGEKIYLTNEMILRSFNLFKEFGYNLRNVILKIVPNENRKTMQIPGNAATIDSNLFLLRFYSTSPQLP